jgi:hypothetical protein
MMPEVYMDDILKAIDYLRQYGKALHDGVHRWAEMLPIITKQHIRQKSRHKLNTTFEHYNKAVKTKMQDYVLVVELDADDWLANAVETGAGQFNMKEGLLKQGFKISKKGHRYRVIPIAKRDEPDESKWGGTDKQRDYQKRIQEVLKKPMFGITKHKKVHDGRVFEYQKVHTHDTLLQGFYRTRAFESVEDFHAGRKKPQWGFVLFRMVSDNPASKAKWDHPGIKPVHIFRETQQWLEEAAEQLLDSMLSSEIEALNQRFKDKI